MTTIQKILFFILFATLSLNATVNNDINSSEELKIAFEKTPTKLLKNVPQKHFLKRFYKKHHYKTVWIKNNNINKEKAHTLITLIQNDPTLSKQGLLYNTSVQLEKTLETNASQEQTLRRELKLTSLYNNFLTHTLYGEIKWKAFKYKLSSLRKRRINASWVKYKAPQKINDLLVESDINQTIESITPKHFGYQSLITGLIKLKKIKENGGWNKLPPFKKLELEDAGDVVKKLRTRLMKSNDYIVCEENITALPKENNQSDVPHINREALFDSCLDKAVKRFQKRHGLAVDGIVGKKTQKALNLSIDDKIRKVLLNIDRIKWLPREDEKRYIAVNLPEFMLHYIEDNQTKQELRVIVGDKRHPTPIFSDYISYIVLNPYWKIPEGIVRREVVPHMIKDPRYLRKQGIEAHRTWDENSRIMNTSFLYWEDYLYGRQKFPYRLMQPPGPKNALGKIKFKFPNRFSVYLHDTPTRYLFKKSFRAYSHGCVRLSQPQELLDTIAGFNKNINLKRAKKILKGKRKKQLNMSNKLRIHLIYLTAGLNSDDELEFRDDLYNYDKYQKRIVR